MSSLDEILHDLCMVRDIDRVPRGHIRLETKFRYPDGGSIDLFILQPHGVLFAPPPLLTDFGQTMAWLADMQVRPWQSKKRQRFVAAIAAHTFHWPQAQTHRRPFGPTKKRATKIRQQLHAAHSGGFSERHSRKRRRN